MPDLEFKIGIMDFNLERLHRNRFPHKFVVAVEDNNHSLFVLYAERHIQVVVRFGLIERQVVGGGDLRVKDGKLFLGYFSSDYGAVPKYVLTKFGDLILPELMDIKEAIINPYEPEIRAYWKNKGFWLSSAKTRTGANRRNTINIRINFFIITSYLTKRIQKWKKIKLQ